MITQIPIELATMPMEHPNMRKWFKIYIENGNWRCDFSPTQAHHFQEVRVEHKDEKTKRTWRCKWCLKQKSTKEVVLYSYNDPKS